MEKIIAVLDGRVLDSSKVADSDRLRAHFFSSVGIALGWAYANDAKAVPALRSFQAAQDAPAPCFKRPAFHAPEPQADGLDDLLNGGPDYADNLAA